MTLQKIPVFHFALSFVRSFIVPHIVHILVFGIITENQIPWFRDSKNAQNPVISRDFHGFTNLNPVKPWKMAKNHGIPGFRDHDSKH